MIDTLTPFTLAWGARPGDNGPYQAKIRSSEELTTALDSIDASAAGAGLAQQVDAMTKGRTITPYGEPDPLIQFLIGHPDRSSLIWHEGDDFFLAVEPDLPLLPQPVIYDRGGQSDEMDPQEIRITPATAKNILTAFLQTGVRPKDVTWREL